MAKGAVQARKKRARRASKEKKKRYGFFQKFKTGPKSKKAKTR
jgi:hypothetical protein